MGLDMFMIKRKKNVKDDEWNEVCYWRKANQIHKWFVDHVQNGVDDCGEYKVTEEQIDELRELCKELVKKIELRDGQVYIGSRYDNRDGKFVEIREYKDGKVIANPEVCEEMLPTQEGFFFGHTEYDEWYYEELKDTIEQLEKALAVDFNEYDLIYTSSW